MTLRLLLMLVGLVAAVSAQGCQFPPELTDVNSWQTKQGMQATTYRFTADHMDTTTFTPLGELEVSHECIGQYANKRYLLTWKELERTVYSCYQLDAVSRNVLIARSSNLTSDLASAESACESGDLPLTFHDLPLVNKKRFEINENLCGFKGGFDFYIQVNEKLDLCKNTQRSLQPRLEVGCSDDPGMHVNFQNNFNCRGHLEVELEQTLTCLGTWERDDYRFTVVSNGKQLLPKLYLVRFPKDVDVLSEFTMPFFAEMKMDMSAVPKPTLKPYINSMIMVRKDFSTLCEDEANQAVCEKICNPDYAGDVISVDDIHCMKTCNLCPSVRDDCNFQQDVRGEWLKAEEPERIVVTKSVLYLGSQTPQKCLNLSGDTSASDAQAVVSVHTNGCKPKYSCVYLKPRGPNVMLYALGEPIPWPFTTSLNARGVCDGSPPGNFSIAMKRDIENPVDCGIRGNFALGCVDSSLQSCDFRDVFRLSFSASCHEEKSATYQCLASYMQGPTRILVTQSESNTAEKQCWVIHANDYMAADSTSLYQLPLEYCAMANVAEQLQKDMDSDSNPVLNNYSLRTSSYGFDDERNCNRVPKSVIQTTIDAERTSSEPGSSKSTTMMELVTQHIPTKQPTSERPYNNVDSINELPQASTGGAARLSGPVVAVGLALIMRLFS